MRKGQDNLRGKFQKLGWAKSLSLFHYIFLKIAKQGWNIKIARLKKGISQEELAEKVNTSRTTISMIETARQNPTILKIIDIAKVLETDINKLTEDV